MSTMARSVVFVVCVCSGRKHLKGYSKAGHLELNVVFVVKYWISWLVANRA